MHESSVSDATVILKLQTSHNSVCVKKCAVMVTVLLKEGSNSALPEDNSSLSLIWKVTQTSRFYDQHRRSVKSLSAILLWLVK